MWSWSVLLVVSLGVVLGADPPQTWYSSATVYQVYPRSFKDSDGDGVGDLKGITQMASYFKEIGVTAVWLSPIFTSPMADFGYDISNFTDIDPLFGTIEDFEELVATFRKLDIKILLDFVPNHSSNEHPWFLKSIKNDTDYKDFYVWRNPKYDINGTRLPPNNWISVFSGSAWEWVPERNQYYLRQFAIQQPDLDYRNPAVKGNMTAVINFWLDKGVDGFRMDAVAHCFEAANFTDEPAKPGTPGNTYETLQHIYTQNQPETYAMLREWAEMLHERSQQDGRQRVMILEVYYPTPLAVTYYGSGNASLMFPFNFNLLTYGNQSVRAPFIKSLIDDWIFYAPKGSQYNWAVGNHDNIRAANRYGTEMVDSINLLTGVLPGIKVVYNGEEMGMENTYVRWDQTVDPSGIRLGPYRYLEGSRDPQRTPMQWDDTPSSGFSQNQDTWLPINPNYWWLNVEAQRNSKTSHLKVFQTLMQARKDPVMQYGGVDLYAPDNDTLVIKRSYQGEYFALLINMGSQQRSFTSQSLFSSLGLDLNMYVVVSSINSNYSPGLYQQKGSLNITLRPKASVLLTTKTWSSNSTGSDASQQLTISLLAFMTLFLSKLL